jgi:ATP phosphoribosyltransferase
VRPVTPRGFRDVLFQEAAERRVVADAIRRSFASWGYAAVETPIVEEYRTLESGAGGSLDGTAFRLFDSDGTLLALRPEMTLPIARLVSTRLAGEPGPYRICYTADVFREHASLRGEAREFTQAGIEFLGSNGPASDAEIISVLADALAAAGLRDYTIGVGTVAVLRALLRAAGGDAEWCDAVMRAAHDRDLVAIDRLSRVEGIDAGAGAAVRELPRIGGGREAIDRCRDVLSPAGCAESLDALDETWALLEATGVADRVRIDFGILRSFDYYTGLIVEAYAPGLGVPLGGGGRYDEVLAAYGSPMPAAGFALTLERVRIALEQQGVIEEVPPLDAVVGGHRRAGTACRRVGRPVRLGRSRRGPGRRRLRRRGGECR